MEGSFFLGLMEIILINIVLSGDNAVVIALACRNLPADLQKKAIFWGSGGAIGLRAILTVVAVWLLKIPFLQLVGGLLLFWIAIKLLAGDNEEEELKGGSNIREAIKTIIIADLVMSLDNVVAVAGAAGGNMLLIALGLGISIPLIIWGSQLLMALMNRFPIIITAGAGLLGYTAGEMILGDKAAGHYVESMIPSAHYTVPVVGVLIVLIVGKLLSRKHPSELKEVS